MTRWAVLLGLAFLTGCYCPRCPVDSADGLGVYQPARPGSSDRGALGSVFELVAAECGPTSPEAAALDAALTGEGLLIGRFIRSKETGHLRGYVLMKDGRVALDRQLVHAAPPDSSYLADSRVWTFIPYFYAAGWRLSHGGSWADSMEAGSTFAHHLAAALSNGEHRALLPPETDVHALSTHLGSWRAGW